MAIENLNSFLQDYFTAHNCQIQLNKEGVLQVKLTEEIDKSLMNRPFYWHYMNKMGREGETTTLTLITNPNKREEKGDWIHFGSPRLQQILKSVTDNERFTKLFQSDGSIIKSPLFPWLVVNIKISYQGKQNKDEIISLGLHLINGLMYKDMMSLLERIKLKPVIDDYCYTIAPIIKMESGFTRIETVLDDYINNQTHTWADEALHTLQEEMQLINHFYTDSTDEAANYDHMQKEIDAVKERYTPKVTYHVINGGIFYLKEDF
ncbi:YqhG family protein [Virgibacillus flavescens]|uniref:YqhG family protein n=1 Tax=Virgibacillus flavescens TaxID=1611422 RepID=UPI003D32A9F7